MEIKSGIKLPKRPNGLVSVFILAFTVLIAAVPPWLSELLIYINLIQKHQLVYPLWVVDTVPIFAVLIIGGYAVYVQYLDKRRYEEIFSYWQQASQIYGFKALQEIVIEKIDPEIRDLVETGRKQKSFIISASDSKFSDGIDILKHITEKGNGLVRYDQKQRLFTIHPDLIVQENDPQQSANGIAQSY